MQNKVLPIALPPDSYTKLVREARANERDPVQQARWILKNALTDRDGDSQGADHNDPDHVTTTATPIRE